MVKMDMLSYTLAQNKINKTVFIVVILVYITCTQQVMTSCNLTLVNTASQTAAQSFEVYKSRGVHFIKFGIHLQNSSGVQKLEIQNTDTFNPSLWVWATQEGKYMLRLPLDSDLLSMGLLTFHEASIDMTISESTEDCLYQLTADGFKNAIASFLMESVVSLNASSIIGDEIICRSAYTFKHYFFTYDDGAGYKCCLANNNGNSNNTNLITCDTSYSEGWELVWMGPLVILLWVYILVTLSMYKNVRRDYKKMAAGFLIIEQFIDSLKEDVILKIEKTGSKLHLAKSPSDLLSFHEKVQLMDALGISKRHQGKFVKTAKACVVIFFLVGYYGYVSFSLYYYWKIHNEIQLLKSSSELYINVFGHMGWLYGNNSLTLQHFSIFEVIITFIIPLLIVFNYISFKVYGQAKKDILSKKLKDIKDGNEIGFTNKTQEEESVVHQTCYCKFTLSLPGRIIQAISCVVILLYLVGVGSVYVVHSVFFVFLGLFVSLDVLGTWLIPMMIFLYYITVAFNPLVEYYKTVKQKLFEICKEDREDILISQTREMFLPRKLLDDFYLPRSRERVFATIQNILLAMAILLMIFLVLLCVQYPSMNLNTSGSSILGVNIVILLPFLAGSISSGQINDYELEILTFDLKQFVKTWTNGISDKYNANQSPSKKNNKQKGTNKVSTVSSPKHKNSKSEKESTTSFINTDHDTDSNENFAERMESENNLKGIPQQALLEPLPKLTK